MSKQAQRKYPPELRRRAVEMFQGSDVSVRQISRDLGEHYETVRLWLRQAQADADARSDVLTTTERAEIKRLRKENAELRRANDILKAATTFFAVEADHTRTR